MTQGPQEQLTKISMLCMGLDADDFLYYERCVCNHFRWHHQLQKCQEARVHSTHAYTHAHMYTQTDKRTCFASENYAHTVILGKTQNQQTALKWNVQQKELHLM